MGSAEHTQEQKDQTNQCHIITWVIDAVLIQRVDSEMFSQSSRATHIVSFSLEQNRITLLHPLPLWYTPRLLGPDRQRQTDLPRSWMGS